MLPILEFILGGFWRFIGALILFCLLVVLSTDLLNFLLRVWTRFIRFLNILRAGWPPPHCDADGDLVPPKK
jgi:hypothetical protein